MTTVGTTSSAIHESAALIRQARHLTAFTGAGISVESGIPPFRGSGGLWSRYDPRCSRSATSAPTPRSHSLSSGRFSTTTSAPPVQTAPTRCWPPVRRAAC
ncbi:MAG: hypothetical protein NTU88_17695 [Armatimonadetes bacterium]|nr:hypothetical protein [Armatimonadota bacterium]